MDRRFGRFVTPKLAVNLPSQQPISNNHSLMHGSLPSFCKQGYPCPIGLGCFINFQFSILERGAKTGPLGISSLHGPSEDFSLSAAATETSILLSKMVQSPVDDNDSYFSNDTTNVDSGSEHEVAYETDLTDTDDDLEETVHDGEDSNLIRLLADNEHPPEYYIRQLQEFDESEYTKQDYSDGSTQLLDRIEGQWYQ
jgi:hypothetical protein